MDQSRRGYLYVFGAYLCWGFMPVYFKLLLPSGPLEILAHRVVWAVVFVAALLSVTSKWHDVGSLFRRGRTLAGIALASALIGINWFTYIYGVNSGHVVETSLGYFINPLISVAFGVVLLGERLSGAQWLALGIGTAAVIVLTVDYGRPPYIALVLAASFGSYGLVKKRLALPPAEGLFVESAMLAAPMLVYLGFLSGSGRSTFGYISGWHTVLLVLAGVVTAVPLLLFAGAANRIPMAGLGLMQYLTPSLQLLLGVTLYHEPMPSSRLAGFALVWLALAVFTWDIIRRARAARRSAPTGPAAVAVPAMSDPAGGAVASGRTDPTGTGEHVRQLSR